MGSKVFKGQEQQIEGSLVGEPIIVTKTAKTPTLQIEYLAEAKYATPDYANRHFIFKFTYDFALSVDRILQASNDTRTEATQVTVDTTIDKRGIKITIVGGDFSEVNDGDEFSLTTTLNDMQAVLIKLKLSDTELILEPTNLANPIVDETNTPIGADDLIIRLQNEKTKDFSKRRWDHRERYIYV